MDRFLLAVHSNSVHMQSDFIAELRQIVGYANLSVISGLPNLETWPNNGLNTLLIIEDALGEMPSPEVSRLLTFSSHHSNISCLFTSHGYFTKGANNRVIQANITHLCLLPTPADQLSLTQLEKRIFPESKSKVLQRAMQWVLTNKKTNEFRYVFCDFSPRSSLPPYYIVKTNIFPVTENDGKQVIRPVYFLPKDVQPVPQFNVQVPKC